MAKFSQRYQEYRPSKTALFWSCVGSVVVVLILGFTWGGWTTGASARNMAEEAAQQAQAKLAAAVCVNKFMTATDAGAQLASLKEIESSWKQENFVEDGGWVTIAGEKYGDAAEPCAEMLMKQEIPAAQAAAESDTQTIAQ